MNIILLAQGIWCHDAISAIEDNPCLNISALVGDIYTYTLTLCKNFYYLPKTRLESDNLIKNLIRKYDIDFILSIQYPYKIDDLSIKLLNGNIFNIHNAKLPDYRGHNSLSYEILNSEIFHTTTMHKISKDFDRGYLVDEFTININSNDTSYSLWERSKKSPRKIINRINKDFLKREFPKIIGEGKFYSKNIPNDLKLVKESENQLIKDKFARAFWFPPHIPAQQINKDGSLEILKVIKD